MLKPTASVVAAIACVSSASAQVGFPDFDAARATFSYSDDMDFDGGPGGLAVSKFEIRSLLSKPLVPIEGLTILPLVEYRATGLDFDGTGGAYPIDDEDLHSLALSSYFFRTCATSPWIYGGWARAEFASDFQEIGSDDFTFDLGGGVGYRFSDRFTLGVGGVVLNLNGDPTVYPGIVFDWLISDQIRVGFYGPRFFAAYTPDPNWEFSIRADSGGDVWNITDDNGASRSIDLTSYRVGIFADRRLTAQLWLTAGAGATVGNEIELTRPDGDQLFKQELESGLFAQIGLRLRTW